jgi:hypothetical protein
MIEEKIKELHAIGKTMKEISELIGDISYAKVRKIHIQLNLTPNSKSDIRHEKILEIALANPDMSYEEIRKIVNYTRQNVSAVCLSNGIRRRQKKNTVPKPKSRKSSNEGKLK